MQAEMVATAYGKVQIHWLRDIVSEIEIGRGLIRCFLIDGPNFVMTVNSGKVQSDTLRLRLLYHSIYDATGKGKIEIKYVAGTEMLPDALPKALRGVKPGEFVKDFGLG
jgi:hypothetical protein